MSGEVVPLGKYKGQPVEVLLADRDYCEWLTAQSWFRDKYQNVYNVIINYGTEPQDSPEHNQMQARFLDDQWCLKLAARLADGEVSDVRNRHFEYGGWDVVFWATVPCEVQAVDGSWKPGTTSDRISVECKPDLGDDYPAVLRQVIRYRSANTNFYGKACVLARRYAFQSVTWEQVREIFAASSITLLAEHEVKGE